MLSTANIRASSGPEFSFGINQNQVALFAKPTSKLRNFVDIRTDILAPRDCPLDTAATLNRDNYNPICLE